jgi:hypothetical protein
MGEGAAARSRGMEGSHIDSGELIETIDETRQAGDPVAEEESRFVVVGICFDQRRQHVVAGGGSVDNTRAIQVDDVLATARNEANSCRVAFRKHLEMVVQLSVEYLLRSCEVEGVETSGADKGLGDEVRPGVSEAQEADSRLGVDGRADDLFTVIDLGEDRPVKMEIEVEAVRRGFAIRNRGDRGIDQSADGDRQLTGDAEEQSQLIIGVNAGHSNDDLIRICAVGVPHRFQMRVSEIGSPQITRERAPERCGPQLLPKPAVETARLEAGGTLSVESDREFGAIDHCEAKTRP